MFEDGNLESFVTLVKSELPFYLLLYGYILYTGTGIFRIELKILHSVLGIMQNKFRTNNTMQINRSPFMKLVLYVSRCHEAVSPLHLSIKDSLTKDLSRERGGA